METIIALQKIVKTYDTGLVKFNALDGVDLSIKKGEFVVILGPSGAGKSTLLNLIGGMDIPTSGSICVDGQELSKYTENQLSEYRAQNVGFIFQFYNILPTLTVKENVALIQDIAPQAQDAEKVLEQVGLKAHMHQFPNQLSGGQMQRVAIARALANDPDIILADEPTGALDTKTSVQIMELIKKIAKDKLVIMVTHNPELAKNYASRIIEFKDGDLISDSNPVTNEENEKKFSIKKTSMSFLTALKLSFNNIKTKKGRTFITSLASSIGIIGIALILALSNGFKIQIDKFERDTLSQMPIVISPTVMTADEEAQKEFMKEHMGNGENAFTDKKEIYPLKSIDSITHNNNINLDYVNYIEKIDDTLIGGISYTRATKLNILYKNKIEGINNEHSSTCRNSWYW